MRCRKNDVGLVHDDAATAWRKKFAGPNLPNLYANDDEVYDEDVSFDVDVSLFDSIPAVQEAIAMSARDPLSTVLHYDVYVRVSRHPHQRPSQLIETSICDVYNVPPNPRRSPFA